jgi:ribonucleoside-diphosphate reductase alpha chain
MNAEDSREGWANIMHQSTMGLMSGAGIGIWYGDLRGEGRPIRKTGGFSSGPLALMQMVNEAGRWIRQGGDRRSAIWAGLPWDHSSIHKFITMKNWSEEVRAMKAKDYNFPATMDRASASTPAPIVGSACVTPARKSPAGTTATSATSAASTWPMSRAWRK